MRRFFKSIIIGLSILGLTLMMSPSSVKAQDVATGEATATVQTILAVTATSSLIFGSVYQGVAATIANTVGDAGVFTITGQGLAGLSLYLALPEFMATASGDDRMSIFFNSTDASIDTTGNADPTSFATGFANVDPHSLPAAPVGGGGTSALFLGGTITPSVNQKAGAYTGDITLTVAYDGT